MYPAKHDRVYYRSLPLPQLLEEAKLCGHPDIELAVVLTEKLEDLLYASTTDLNILEDMEELRYRVAELEALVAQYEDPPTEEHYQ